jgi:flavin reductase (DIM6/NTAB) family NADH-FMN oxidoreductase RutF
VGAAGFDQLMGGLDQPMVILTAASAGVRSGCLVGFHGQSAITPPRYAVWLSKANHTYRIGALADTFTVHFLHADQHALAELFGSRTGDDVDKFEQCAWTPGPDGVPLLDECPDRFTGRRQAWLDAGADHVCLLLEPIDVEVSGRHDWLTLHDVDDVEPGHAAEERQDPA